MNIPYIDIKREMQGSKGLIKIVRGRFLPGTIEMAKLAQESFEQEGESIKDVDAALNRLLILEYQIYLLKQDQIDRDFVSYADEVASEVNFPNIRKALNDFRSKIAAGQNPTHSLKNIGKIYAALADSNRQSRVARAGSSLMEHISYLLQKKGFKIFTDYHREKLLGSGCKVDFVFPDVNIYLKEPENCFVIACQTTANDRFRLSIAQMPQMANSRNRTCTAIGCSNFGEKLGPKSLTTEKIAEAKRNNVKFVIIGSAIDDRLRNSGSVMSYNDWFAELTHMKPLWFKI
jgi:hypothetical protein